MPEPILLDKAHSGARDDPLSTLRVSIREGLATGSIPNGKPVAVGVGQLTPALCVICGLASNDKGKDQCDVRMADGQTFRFHRPCLQLWYEECVTFAEVSAEKPRGVSG